MYLDILKIGHKVCSVQSILTELTLQKVLQSFITNNVVLKKNVKNTTTTKNTKQANKKFFPQPGIETVFSHRSRMRYLLATKTTERID